jgi:UMF1 family MFS transporter
LKNLYQKKSKENKAKIFVWTLYDFANTSYSIIVVTFIFAVYFKEVIANSNPIGDLYWSLGVSISMFITAGISPVLGAIADYSAGKKRFLLFFSLLCIFSTALLYFTGPGTITAALLLFILANIGFESALVFYDAFLPEITVPKNYGRVSGYGFAMGYLGSLASLALIYPFIQKNLIKETLPLSALFFLVFALPIFLFLHDSRRKKNEGISYFKVGFERVAFTLSHLREHKNLAVFLLSFFFYIEGVNTVIFFAGNYAKTTLQFSMQSLMMFFLIVQSTAILGSVFFGILADSIGQKKTVIISLLIWIFTITLAFFTSSTDSFLNLLFARQLNIDITVMQKYSFYLIGLLAGMVMGATQSTSRSLMSKLTPPERKTEFFGFYSLFGKSSAILGPLVFGAVSYLTGQQKFAILTINVFFIVGLTIFSFVKEPESAV